jgi:hypothetical protein
MPTRFVERSRGQSAQGSGGCGRLVLPSQSWLLLSGFQVLLNSSWLRHRTNRPIRGVHPPPPHWARNTIMPHPKIFGSRIEDQVVSLRDTILQQTQSESRRARVRQRSRGRSLGRFRRRIDRFSATPFVLVSAAKAHLRGSQASRASSAACRSEVGPGRSRQRGSWTSAMSAARTQG